MGWGHTFSEFLCNYRHWHFRICSKRGKWRTSLKRVNIDKRTPQEKEYVSNGKTYERSCLVWTIQPQTQLNNWLTKETGTRRWWVGVCQSEPTARSSSARPAACAGFVRAPSCAVVQIEQKPRFHCQRNVLTVKDFQGNQNWRATPIHCVRIDFELQN